METMYAALRYAAGVISVGVLGASVWIAQQRPALRTWDVLGPAWPVPMAWLGLWTAQVSYLLFALSRWFKRRAYGRPFRAWETAALRPWKPMVLGTIAQPLVWVAWCLLRGGVR